MNVNDSETRTLEQLSSQLSTTSVRRRTLLRVALGTAVAGSLTGLLAACGGEDEDVSGPSGEAAATPTVAAETSDATPDAASDATPAAADETSEPATTTDSGEADSEAIAIYASAVDVPNIDPAVGHDGAISETQKALYDTLYRHAGNPAELIPWLATGHEVSDDATEWTFTIDERAKFQDGSPVTAEAVVYSATRVLQINKGVAWMFKGVLEETGVEAVDDQTVKFTLVEPFGPFLHAIAWLFVVNPAVVQENEVNGDLGQDWLISNSAGSGPFKIKRWEPGTLYEFESDPDYWRGWENPRLKGYIRQVSRESSTKRLGLTSGEIHAGDYMSVEDSTLLQDTAGVVVPSEPGITTYSIKLNHQRGPTADVNVRRAMAYAFDYDAMISLMADRAVRLHGPLTPNLIGVNEDLVPYETDIEKAKAELAKSAEWKDGFDIEFAYVTGLEEERQTGLILLDQLSKLNINVTITPMEWANAVALFADPEQSPLMFPMYSGSDYPDPDNFLWQSFHSSSAGTWTGSNHYNNPEVDSLLEEARSLADWDQRAELYAQAQQILVDDAAEIFVFGSIAGLVHREELKGYEFCPVMGSNVFWYQLYI